MNIGKNVNKNLKRWQPFLILTIKIHFILSLQLNSDFIVRFFFFNFYVPGIDRMTKGSPSSWFCWAHLEYYENNLDQLLEQLFYKNMLCIPIYFFQYYFQDNPFTLTKRKKIIFSNCYGTQVLREFGQNSKQTGRSMLPDTYFLI